MERAVTGGKPLGERGAARRDGARADEDDDAISILLRGAGAVERVACLSGQGL
jgi:hypothetical protein